MKNVRKEISKDVRKAQIIMDTILENENEDIVKRFDEILFLLTIQDGTEILEKFAEADRQTRYAYCTASSSYGACGIVGGGGGGSGVGGIGGIAGNAGFGGGGTWSA